MVALVPLGHTNPPFSGSTFNLSEREREREPQILPRPFCFTPIQDSQVIRGAPCHPSLGPPSWVACHLCGLDPLLNQMLSGDGHLRPQRPGSSFVSPCLVYDLPTVCGFASKSKRKSPLSDFFASSMVWPSLLGWSHHFCEGLEQLLIQRRKSWRAGRLRQPNADVISELDTISHK